MEIVTKQIEMNQLGKTIGNQFVMDEDYNVPDGKQDVKRIILSEGRLVLDEMKMMENHLRVKGKMEFKVLYETDQAMPVISGMEGKIPFEEILYLDEMTDDNLILKSNRVDLKVSLIHSRKLRIKTIIDLAFQQEKRVCEEIPVDVTGEGNIYKKQEKMELLKLHTSKRDSCRVKEEITLPGAKESIETILWMDVSNRKLDVKLVADQVQLSGELLLFCIYESPDEKLDWIEQSVPYTGKMDCQGIHEKMFHHFKANLEEVKMEARMDEDGEMRLIGIDGVLYLDICIYEEENVEVLRDIYSLEQKCVLETKEAICEQLILQNHSKCKVMERLSIPELQNEVLQICHSKGEVVVEELEVRDDGVLISGIIYVSFLYVKSSDEMPFDVWHGIIPFSHLVECDNKEKRLKYDISTSLEQLSIMLQGGNEIEVKAMLTFQGFFREEGEIRKIGSIHMEPIPMKEIEKRPSVVGYVVKKDDDLWELAKRYSTSVEAICQLNELKEEAVKPGDRLLIFKENMSIL